MTKCCKGYCQTIDKQRPRNEDCYALGWRYCRVCRHWWHEDDLVKLLPYYKTKIVCACCTSLVRQKARIYGWRKRYGSTNRPD